MNALDHAWHTTPITEQRRHGDRPPWHRYEKQMAWLCFTLAVLLVAALAYGKWFA